MAKKWVQNRSKEDPKRYKKVFKKVQIRSMRSRSSLKKAQISFGIILKKFQNKAKRFSQISNQHTRAPIVKRKL